MEKSSQPPGVNPQPPPPVRQCMTLDTARIIPDVFSPGECAQIIADGLQTWQKQAGTVQTAIDGRTERDPNEAARQNLTLDSYRETTLYVPSAPVPWLFNRLLGTIMVCNSQENGWGFQIGGFAEPPNLMEYNEAGLNPSRNPGQYGFHIDVGAGAVPSMRKVSYSVLLNAGAYEGGALQIKVGMDDAPVPGQDRPGTMILFPSYLLHRVHPVTRGRRYALVGWAHGNSFV